MYAVSPCSFALLFLHIEILIAFSRRLAEWRLCSKLCSSPTPSSFLLELLWNKAREPQGERGGEEKRLSHTPREWWILFGLCLLSLSLADLVCYVGFYGEKQRLCQTWLVQGIKKKESMCRDREWGGGGGWRDNKGNSIPRILRVWNHREKDSTDTKYMCSEAKTAAAASFVSRWTNWEIRW